MSITLGIRRACVEYEVNTGHRLVQVVLARDDFQKLLGEVKNALRGYDDSGNVACLQVGDCLVTSR